MRKFMNLLILLPLAVVLIVLSVANRQTIQLSLDPFNTDDPALSVALPFFVFLFGALLAGIVIGWLASWWNQRKYRLELRAKRSEVERYQRQLENPSHPKNMGEEFAPGLPVLSKPDKAA